jgi:predicted small lipoprotein YifL
VIASGARSAGLRSGVVVAAVLALTGCRSSAPYTLPSAAVNTAIAAGASAAQKSAGGCYAQCVGGTICNPRTGFCESQGAVCVGAEAESPACLNRAGPTMGTSAPGPAGSSAAPLPIGVSPATGSVPPPPGARP